MIYSDLRYVFSIKTATMTVVLCSAHGAARIKGVSRKAVTDMAKDSLTNFANVLYSEAAKQKQQAVQELEDKKKDALDKATADAETRYKKELKKYKLGLEYEVKLDISRREAELSKVLRQNRAAAADEVFAVAAKKLGEFTKTDGYGDYLKSKFDELAAAFESGNDTVCIVRGEDAELVRGICPVQISEYKDAPNDIIGGFMLKSRELKLYADCTLKSELEKQKGVFCKISGLIIE